MHGVLDRGVQDCSRPEAVIGDGLISTHCRHPLTLELGGRIRVMGLKFGKPEEQPIAMDIMKAASERGLKAIKDRYSVQKQLDELPSQ